MNGETTLQVRQAQKSLYIGVKNWTVDAICRVCNVKRGDTADGVAKSQGGYKI